MAAMRALMASMLLTVLGAMTAAAGVEALTACELARAADEVGVMTEAAAADDEDAAACASTAGALFSSLRADLKRARMASMEDMEATCGSEGAAAVGVVAEVGVIGVTGTATATATAAAGWAAVAILARSCSTESR